MRDSRVLCSLIALLLSLAVHGVSGDSPYRFFTWKITYGDIYPLGVKQQVTLLSCSLFLGNANVLSENTFLVSESKGSIRKS